MPHSSEDTDLLLHSLRSLSVTTGGSLANPRFKHTVVQEVSAELDLFRQELEAETTKDKGTDRKIKALLDYAKQSGRAISENLWIPDAGFFTEFAVDTLVNVQVKDLSGYLRALNERARSLANSLPANHPALPRLTANENKPWHAEAFKKINKLYQQKLVARKHQESLLDGNGILQPKRARKRTARSEAKTVAAPIEQLDLLLSTTEKLKSELTRLYDTAPMSAKDKGHKKFNAKLRRNIKMTEKDFAPGAVCLNGFAFMARASTLGGGLKFNDHQPDKLDQGIQADMVITEPGGSSTAGIAYTIRFLKDWEFGITSHQGEQLPLSYNGTDTLPYEMDPSSDTKKPNSVRNRIIEVIAFAHKHKLLAWINTTNPSQAAQKIDSWLKKQPWTALSDSQVKITSHSFRKAGVSLALASGVSIPNITNWCHWRSAEMPWHYADQKYVAPPKWRNVFAWMKQRPAQNLWA